VLLLRASYSFVGPCLFVHGPTALLQGTLAARRAGANDIMKLFSANAAFYAVEAISAGGRLVQSRGGVALRPDQTEDVMDSTQSEVRALLDSQSEAMSTKDIDRLMSLYSPDIIYFDTVPPLQYAGAAALRGRFLQWFDGWKGVFTLEIRDVQIVVSGDIAVAYRFSRACGILMNGQEAGSWVRATSCFQRSRNRWLICHEHVSWPVDVKSGSVAMDLAP
jgi:ketosteroid isomerase-like protein